MRNGVVVRQGYSTTTNSMKHGQFGRITNGEFKNHVIIRLRGSNGFVSLNNTKVDLPDGTVFPVEILLEGTEIFITADKAND